MRRVESKMEMLMFRSRWLLAPFYLGLIGVIVVLLVKFGQEFVSLAEKTVSLSSEAAIVAALSLIDLALVANLLLIIIFSGYENFVSKIETGDSVDRPDWMGRVDFSDLKIKLIASIAAISGIELLKAFVAVEQLTNEQLLWKVAIHLTFVFSGVMFALMDRLIGHQISRGREANHPLPVPGISSDDRTG